MWVGVGQSEGVRVEVGVRVSVGVDRELFLDWDVAVQRPRGFGVVVLETTAWGWIHIVTGRTEDHVTPLARGHSGAAQPTTLTFDTAVSLEEPSIPGVPRLSR